MTLVLRRLRDLRADRADYGPLPPDKFDEIKLTYERAGGLIPNASCGYIKQKA